MRLKFLVLFLLLNSLFVLGQTTPANDKVLVNSNPPLTEKVLNATIDFVEWHFEMRFTAVQREKYQNFLIEDWKKGGNEIKNMNGAFQFMESLKQKNWLDIAKFHSDQKQVDSIELSTEEMLNNGQVHGSGIRAGMRKMAKKGDAEHIWLLKTINDYEKPLAGNGNIYSSLFRRQIDGTTEWIAFKMNNVAGKTVIELNDATRLQMEQMILKNWNDNKNNADKLSYFRGWLDSNVAEWLVWRAGQYSFTQRQTPFQRKKELVEWGQSVLPYSAEMKPFVEKRIKEYKDYVAKMPKSEVESEVAIMRQTNQAFQAKMAQMQAEGRMMQQTFAQVRSSLLDSHVVNLNIAENIGNGGYVWQIKKLP